jgi:membrane-associated phospholipid phosphatase
MARSLFLLLFLILNGTLVAQNPGSNDNVATPVSTPDSAKSAGILAPKTTISFKSAIVPLSLITAGVIAEKVPSHTVFSKIRIQQHLQDKMNGFHTSADDYLQFVPMAAMFSFKLAGVQSRSDLLNQMILTAKSEMVLAAIVYSMKHFIRVMRPDGSTDNSMPSGHTAQAFVSATLLDMEYRDTSPWISVGGYLCAAATGYLRVANNRHWASDVLIGAGIGIASVKLVYLTHRYRWGKMPSSVVLVPTIYQKGGGVAFAMKF